MNIKRDDEDGRVLHVYGAEYRNGDYTFSYPEVSVRVECVSTGTLKAILLDNAIIPAIVDAINNQQYYTLYVQYVDECNELKSYAIEKRYTWGCTDPAGSNFISEKGAMCACCGDGLNLINEQTFTIGENPYLVVGFFLKKESRR